MTILSASGLEKSFGVDTLFKDVSFTVEEYDKIGFVGVNGAGKTTLFKMLLNEASKDSGEIYKSKFCKIGYMQQHACIDSSNTVYEEIMTVFENLSSIEGELEKIALEIERGNCDLVEKQHKLSEEFESLGGFTYKSRARSALIGLGFSEAELDAKVSTLSGGQRTRVLLCKILLSDANLLLLDEPTNHLDINSVEWLEEFLRSYTGAFIIISHDRYFLDRVTNKTFELENKALTIYGGNYSYYIRKKEEDRYALERHYENTRREIKRIEGIIEQQKRWNRERNIRTAESKQKMIDRLEKDLEAPQNEPDSIRFKFNANQSGGNDVLIAHDLSMAFGDKKLFASIDLFIGKGEKVFLLGPNGCGKTTLLKIITERLQSTGGTVKLGSNVQAGYYDQIQADLDTSKSVIDEVWDAYPKMTQTDVRNALAAFLFKGDDVSKPVSKLSGGERARISLLKLMLSRCNFLLLDEPTNHLDITSREALEDALEGYGGTLLIVSHDRYFINKMANRILYLSNEGLKSYEGNYDYFLEKHSEKPAPKKEVIKKNDYKERKEREAAIRKKEGAIRRTEEEISIKEEEVAHLEKSLENPEIAVDYERVIEISAEIAKLKENLDELYEKWSELNE